METKETAHRRFVALTCAFYRDAGWEDPVFESNADTPVAFKAHVDNVAFSIGYDPLGGDHCLFVYCIFGVVPPSTEARHLRWLLARNASMARENRTYCIDEGTQELACYVRRTMDIDIDALKAELAALAAQAHRWQRGELVDESWGAAVDGETGDLVAWTRLA